MQKFRAAVIAATLAIMFFIPMSVMGIYAEEIIEEVPKTEEKEPLISEEDIYEAEEDDEDFFRIYDIESEKIFNVSYSDYVKGAIASEMGANFEFDALVAQGIAAFSCALYQKEARTAADYDISAAPDKKLGYMTEEKAKEVYGAAFDEKWGIICSAAEKALCYVLTYNGEPALTVYHAISAGKTESCENVWNGALPYLISVESDGDKLAEGYKSEVIVPEKEVLELLNKNGAGLSGAYPEDWFSGAVYTDAGYVGSIKIGAATFSGEKLRSLFSLRSASFDVEYKNGEFIFTVYGYGHGVGLSQVGANYMAKNGADFMEILAHYYPGTELLEYGEVYG
ncbi:MAG: SpoIID/LytB domain-containing protein [Oscillospiraceae bacterium]|nr:SpoIID/LytB domain-containing protein [Oscillospiraceae bacterium]